MSKPTRTIVTRGRSALAAAWAAATHTHAWVDLKRAAPPFNHVTKQGCACGVTRSLVFKPGFTGPFMSRDSHEWEIDDEEHRK